MRARNNFAYILTDSKSAEEFAKRLRVLPRHVHDKHKWEVMEARAEPTTEHCDFHPLRVCSCGNCVKKKITLRGTGSRVRFILSFMKLSVTIEPQWLKVSFITPIG